MSNCVWLYCTCCTLAVTASVPAAAPTTSAPSTSAAPTTSPSEAPVKLPEPFSIFQTVNPFSAKKHGKPGPPSGAEATIVLNGIAQADSGCIAFFQDTASKQALMLSVGDSVGHGKITAIDLDSVQYQSGGATTTVQVGQNLSGQAVATSQPSDSPPANAPDGKPPDDPKKPAPRKNRRGGGPPPDGNPQPDAPAENPG